MRRLMMWVVAGSVSVAIAGCSWCCPKKSEPPAKKEGAKVTTPVPPAKK